MGALNLKAPERPLSSEYPTINALSISRFFNEIRKVYPDYNQTVNIILDGARYHHAQLVTDWAEVVNIKRVQLALIYIIIDLCKITVYHY